VDNKDGGLEKKDGGENEKGGGDDDKKSDSEFKGDGEDNEGEYKKNEVHIPRYVIEYVLSSPLKSNKLIDNIFKLLHLCIVVAKLEGCK
jgi:hypothetical protein